jgi:hypothetical protein
MAQMAAQKEEDGGLSTLTPGERKLIDSNPSLRKILSSGLTPSSTVIYSLEIARFCEWLNLPIEKAIKSHFDWTGISNEYLSSVEKSRNLRARRIIVSALNKWFESNGVKLFEKIPSPYGKLPQRTVRLITKSELFDILQFSDLASKVVLLLSVTSGLDSSTLADLKVKDLSMDKEIPSIQTGNRRTFTTLETKQAIQAFLRLREKRSERISSESFVIGSSRLGYRSIDLRWRDSLARAAVPGLPFSSLKEYFKAWSKVLGMDPSVMDYFIGGKRGKELHRETPEKELLSEYKRVIPALTFFQNNDASSFEIVKERIENLETKVLVLKGQARQERIRYEELRKMNRALLAKRP